MHDELLYVSLRTTNRIKDLLVMGSNGLGGGEQRKENKNKETQERSEQLTVTE